jgi:hypothetical protein
MPGLFGWIVIVVVVVPLGFVLAMEGFLLLSSFIDEVILHPEKSGKYMRPDELAELNEMRAACGKPPYEYP